MWLHSSKSEWGWLPARISKKQVVLKQQKHHKKVQDASGGSSRFRNKPSAHPPSNFPPPVNRSLSRSGRSNSGAAVGGGGAVNAALVKELEDKRRKELQTLMRDRSLEKDARKARMDEVKAKYSKLVEDAKNAPPPAPAEPAPQAAEAAPPPPTEEEKKDLPPEELPPEMTMIELTLVDDFTGLEDGAKSSLAENSGYGRGISGYYAKMEHFKEVVLIESTAAREEHSDIKLRNTASSCSASSIQFYGESTAMNKGAKSNNHMPHPAAGRPSTIIQDTVTGGVDDLIGLTHLHEPAILHALRLRYDADIIYTSTGPILLAINPFKVSVFGVLSVLWFVVGNLFVCEDWKD